MNEIKKYSSDYATKLSFLLRYSLEEEAEKGVIRSVAKITNEKDTTAKNWLFNGKIPRESKRLDIADAVGTSEDYLFNDKLSVTEVKKPEVVKREGCYFVPVIDESEIFAMKEAKVFPIKKREPIMLPHMDELVAALGKNIYLIRAANATFRPYIDKNMSLLYSENFELEAYRFVLIRNDNGDVMLKRIIEDDDTLKLQYFSDVGEEVIESLPPKQSMLAVLLAFSTN